MEQPTNPVNPSNGLQKFLAKGRRIPKWVYFVPVIFSIIIGFIIYNDATSRVKDFNQVNNVNGETTATSQQEKPVKKHPKEVEYTANNGDKYGLSAEVELTKPNSRGEAYVEVKFTVHNHSKDIDQRALRSPEFGVAAPTGEKGCMAETIIKNPSLCDVGNADVVLRDENGNPIDGSGRMSPGVINHLTQSFHINTPMTEKDIVPYLQVNDSYLLIPKQ